LLYIYESVKKREEIIFVYDIYTELLSRCKWWHWTLVV